MARRSIPNGLEKAPVQKLIFQLPKNASSKRGTVPESAPAGLTALASLPATKVAFPPWPALAPAFGTDADASPSPSVMVGLAKLQSVALDLQGKAALPMRLLAAGEKIREGLLLTLSDAMGKYTARGTGVDKGLVEHSAALLERNTGLDQAQAVGEDKLAVHIKSTLLAQQSRFPSGMDISAFVQAVLRESYLLQNEQLRDYAEKVKFYHALKKSLLTKKKAATQNAIQPPLSSWDNARGEWVWWDQPAPERESSPTESQNDNTRLLAAKADEEAERARAARDVAHPAAEVKQAEEGTAAAAGANARVVAVAPTKGAVARAVEALHGYPCDELLANHRRNPQVQPAGDPPAAAMRMPTKPERQAYIKALEDSLQAASADARLANRDLQNALRRQQQTLQMISAISQALHDTALAIIRKLGT